MDDDSCVMKLIEIVPVDNYSNRLDSSGVKLSPCRVKVCMLFILCLFILISSALTLLNSFIGMLIPGKSYSRVSVGQSRDSIETRFGPSTYTCARKVMVSLAVGDSSHGQIH